MSLTRLVEPESDMEESDGPASQRSFSKRPAVGNPTTAKPPPQKKAKVEPTDDSVTEPEEDEEPHWIHSRPQRPSLPVKKPTYSDSETEPETDPEWLIDVGGLVLSCVFGPRGLT